MIKIEQIIKKFGNKTACNIPSFCINKGEILGLVGNNGAGKTTLFRMILDLLKPDSGNIYIHNMANESTEDSYNVALSEEWKKYKGAYIDEGFLIDFLTPEEYFSFLGKICGISENEIETRLEKFKLFANNEIFGQNKLIRNLSAGNRQKVGIISALINNPQLVILDEPFNFLDPTSQNILKNLILEYNKETGATIIISSHNLSHTVEISTRIALLENGEIIRDMINDNNNATVELEQYFEVK